MTVYENILVAIDLHPTCDEIILKRAHALVKGGQVNYRLFMPWNISMPTVLHKRILLSLI
jgi:hypothetical protein